MLPKNKRIPKKYFPYILFESKKYNSAHLLLCIAPIDLNDKNKSSRFSFSISKKVCPLAVDRNKYRRRGYAIISKHLIDVKSGFFYSFSFKKSPLPINFAQLEKEIKGLLEI